MPSDFLSELNQISFGIYTNFFAFLLTILLIDGLLNTIQPRLKRFWKEVKPSRLAFDGNSFSRKRRGAIYLMSEKQIMRILSYALIFMGLQIAGLCFLYFPQSQTFKGYRDKPLVAIESPQDLQSFSDITMVSDDQEKHFNIPRVLEEGEDFSPLDNELVSLTSSSPLSSSDKISLSMGNILSSLSLNVNEMILSKDRKIAYVTLDYYSTLKAIDVSHMQSPSVLGSLNLEISTFAYRIKNLLLSSDQKTLYASNSRDLEIIDVTDPSFPKLISLTKSAIFVDVPVNEATKYMKTSLAVEESTKTLYIGGTGLQVYDISDPKKPALLKAFKNELKLNYGLLRNEICLSHDGQVLFLANGTLDVYHISDPNEMKQIHSFTIESSPRSILLLEDKKTAFLLGNSVESDEIIFEEVEISDFASLKTKSTIKFAQKSINSPRFLAVSPSKSKFF